MDGKPSSLSAHRRKRHITRYFRWFLKIHQTFTTVSVNRAYDIIGFHFDHSSNATKSNTISRGLFSRNVHKGTVNGKTDCEPLDYVQGGLRAGVISTRHGRIITSLGRDCDLRGFGGGGDFKTVLRSVGKAYTKNDAVGDG